MDSFPLTPYRYVGSQKLSGMLLQPYDLYKEGWADAYLMGMVNQVSAASTKPDSTRKCVCCHSKFEVAYLDWSGQP